MLAQLLAPKTITARAEEIRILARLNHYEVGNVEINTGQFLGIMKFEMENLSKIRNFKKKRILRRGRNELVVSCERDFWK